MAKEGLLVKVEGEDRDRWKVEAEKAGVTLSEWIRRQCNREVGYVEDDEARREMQRKAEIRRTEQSENPVAVAFRNMAAKKREKLGAEYFELCEHKMVKAGCPRCKANMK